MHHIHLLLNEEAIFRPWPCRIWLTRSIVWPQPVAATCRLRWAAHAPGLLSGKRMLVFTHNQSPQTQSYAHRHIAVDLIFLSPKVVGHWVTLLRQQMP